MTRIVQYVRQKIAVHVSSELGWRKIVSCIQAEPDSTSYSCFETLLVGRAGITPTAGEAYNSSERMTVC